MIKFDKATEEEMSEEYKTRKGPYPKWPFAKMEVGDFVEVKHGQYGFTVSPQDYALRYGREKGKRFKTKKVRYDTFHIWRIA